MLTSFRDALPSQAWKSVGLIMNYEKKKQST